MLKKSKVVALLVVCVMMFAVVEPACARTWGEFFGETAVGGIIGGLLGVGAVIVTGGAALPLVVGGATIGAAVGATPEDQRAGVIGGTGAGIGATMMFNALQSQQQQQPMPQY